MNMILDFVNDVNTENVEIKSLHIHCIQKCDKKECALAHSRAEARLLQQPSTFAPSAHPCGALFCFIGRNFL